jgi:hypothetical protein
MRSQPFNKEPDTRSAVKIAVRALGRVPRSVKRFRTGAQHYVFDLEFDSGPPVVVRLAAPSARRAITGAARQLDRVAAEVAQAQALTATIGTAGRYGYAARVEDAPHAAWSQVLDANLARSRRRIVTTRLFGVGFVDLVQEKLDEMRRELDDIAPTPFLHDTTTRNVIVTQAGDFSGIVDVDDLCLGDPRYPAALTLAVMVAYGGPVGYVSAWLRHAGQSDDRVFHLYRLLFLVDLMSEHGHRFNGNARPSTVADRAALQRAFKASLSYGSGS